MLFLWNVPYSRNHLRARGSIQSGSAMISLDIRSSLEVLHSQLVAIDCSFTMTFAHNTENWSSGEEYHILDVIIER